MAKTLLQRVHSISCPDDTKLVHGPSGHSQLHGPVTHGRLTRPTPERRPPATVRAQVLWDPCKPKVLSYHPSPRCRGRSRPPAAALSPGLLQCEHAPLEACTRRGTAKGPGRQFGVAPSRASSHPTPPWEAGASCCTHAHSTCRPVGRWNRMRRLWATTANGGRWKGSSFPTAACVPQLMTQAHRPDEAAL